MGGNLGNGMPDRSLAPALLALGCSVTLHSHERGKRSLPLPTFLLGSGRTALAADELITAVACSAGNGFQRYTQVGPRAALVYPTVARPWWWIRQRWLALGIANAADTAIRAEQAEAEAAASSTGSNAAAGRPGRTFGQWAAEACTPSGRTSQCRLSPPCRRRDEPTAPGRGLLCTDTEPPHAMTAGQPTSRAFHLQMNVSATR